MKFKETKLHCGQQLIKTLQSEITEIEEVLRTMEWEDEFSISVNGKTFHHQRAYNKAFEIEFLKRGWDAQPRLKESPKLIGDFSKDLTFIEVQFGNSSTLYRDFYKFQYGFQNELLSLGVLIVPGNEHEFFPTRPESVRNMSNFDLAVRYFTILPINVPTWIIGLLPEK
jgi:Restriction endonuclease BglII